MKTVLVTLMLLGPQVYLMACALIREFCNNGEQKKRVVTVVRSENNRAIIGDGAWHSSRASYPSERLRRLREIEPRGA